MKVTGSQIDLPFPAVCQVVDHQLEHTLGRHQSGTLLLAPSVNHEAGVTVGHAISKNIPWVDIMRHYTVEAICKLSIYRVKNDINTLCTLCRCLCA